MFYNYFANDNDFQQHVLEGGAKWYFAANQTIIQIVRNCFKIFGHINFFDIMGCKEFIVARYVDGKRQSIFREDKITQFKARALEKLDYYNSFSGHSYYDDKVIPLITNLYHLLVHEMCGSQINWLRKEYLKAMDYAPSLGCSARAKCSGFTLWDFVWTAHISTSTNIDRDYGYRLGNKSLSSRIKEEGHVRAHDFTGKCLRCKSTSHIVKNCPRLACFCCGRSGHKDETCIYVHPSARVGGKIVGCYNCGSQNHTKSKCHHRRYLPMPLNELINRKVQLPREYAELDLGFSVPVYRKFNYK
ncbi:hypothetical protein Mgra_00007308 [Meloidogyne graminicola]|uniref:CCHC-type domain-containing protein n=1 Tax=Meloidogyne graminicola TaxID=189291 RepID=A0A8S9ZJ38_9BILA|nr:hypothetical protein Mgra_00007308 [Meloidogyne graminicola]